MSDLFVIAAKVFSVGLAFIAISKSYLGFRAKVESLQIFLFWVVTWLGIVVVALFPTIIDVVMAKFGGGRTGPGTFLGLGLVFLFFIVYRIYLKLERLEQNVSKTIQEIALRDDWMPKR